MLSHKRAEEKEDEPHPLCRLKLSPVGPHVRMTESERAERVQDPQVTKEADPARQGKSDPEGVGHSQTLRIVDTFQ